ncbi:MAG: iron chelate uptake ABC transporter family permease subunit, partial [Deltaproteobacteria bacterium]|nr:iron chelate uptake ABC transporter family permease subunit [Deltaproteobacteria bacterium]
MSREHSHIVKRLSTVSGLLLMVLVVVMLMGVSIGSSGSGVTSLWHIVTHQDQTDPMLPTIIWKLRLPRVLLAALVGAALSLGGLVFQALLRNPLAEPYILGISGGSAIGAIIGILLGLSQ